MAARTQEEAWCSARRPDRDVADRQAYFADDRMSNRTRTSPCGTGGNWLAVVARGNIYEFAAVFLSETMRERLMATEQDARNLVRSCALQVTRYDSVMRVIHWSSVLLVT